MARTKTKPPPADDFDADTPPPRTRPVGEPAPAPKPKPATGAARRTAKSAEEQLEDLGLLSKRPAPAAAASNGTRVNPCDLHPPAKPKPGPDFYGWEITYKTHDNQLLICRYVGTEKQARKKAMLRSKAMTIVECVGITEEQWVRAYGRGKS